MIISHKYESTCMGLPGENSSAKTKSSNMQQTPYANSHRTPLSQLTIGNIPMFGTLNEVGGIGCRSTNFNIHSRQCANSRVRRKNTITQKEKGKRKVVINEYLGPNIHIVIKDTNDNNFTPHTYCESSTPMDGTGFSLYGYGELSALLYGQKRFIVLDALSRTSTWNSPSGQFAFGFQNVLFDNKDLMPVLAVWFAKDPNQTIVCGSFVLLDNDRKQVWESFEEPTDTILPGQNLAKPKTFRARQSDTSFNDGRFELAWQGDSTLVLYFSSTLIDEITQSPTYIAYWATGTYNTESQLFFGESGRMYIKNDTSDTTTVVLNGGTEDFLYMARIDPDGVFRLYQHRKDENTSANSCSSE
ncbi:G-type lectin S-receptor serine/threonine-protein kinase RLK1 [Spatholobus suberectus]|nr:G-type lectin S-receptor serine/threonine-protein kinase RLK1 [Spatholobus suberectus]